MCEASSNALEALGSQQSFIKPPSRYPESSRDVARPRNSPRAEQSWKDSEAALLVPLPRECLPCLLSQRAARD